MRRNRIEFQTLNPGDKPAKRLMGWSVDGHEVAWVTVYDGPQDDVGTNVLLCACVHPTSIDPKASAIANGSCLPAFVAKTKRHEESQRICEHFIPKQGLKATLLLLLQISHSGDYIGEERLFSVTLGDLQKVSKQSSSEVEQAIAELLAENEATREGDIVRSVRPYTRP